MRKEKKIPSLRFPEFEGDWKLQKGDAPFFNSRERGEQGLPIYSVTLDRGMVRRDSLDRQMGANAADETNLRAQKNDLVYNMMRMWQGAVGKAPEECMVSPAYVVLSPKATTSPDYFNQWFKSAKALYKLGAYSHGLTSDRLRLYHSDFAQIPMRHPLLPEQRKIAVFLGTIDKKIDQLRDKRDLLTDYKKGVMQQIFSQQIRFTREDGTPFPDWEERELGKVLSYEQPTKYLVESSEYQQDFDTPVLTAGKTFILGYTNEKSGIYNHSLPAIIFDDFTTANKFVDFPFKAKSSAMKILTPREKEINLKVVFEFMQKIRFPRGEHKRYWISEFQHMPLPLPTDPDEQQEIANFISALDDKINAVATQLEHMQAFKQGLLQQMFV